jgi:glutamyl-tRNA reductase
MPLIVLGLNHETAPITVRERLAFAPSDLPMALHALLAETGVFEAAILSTCNRTELYCNAREACLVLNWLAHNRGRRAEELAAHLYVFEGEAAARHISRVAAGLDSMVLGENQILGQLRDAEKIAREAGTLGVLLNGLFQHAFAVGREVRASTRIGAASISMAAASVKLAERIFPSVAECAVLFVGAGEMIELCARHFAEQQPRKMAVANRTRARAEALAAAVEAEALLLTDLPLRFAEFDVVITSTASSLPLIGKGMVERAIKARRRRPIFIVDLAVPRDVEAEVAQLADAYLYTVDDLADIVRQGVAARSAEVGAAEDLIEARLADFRQWLTSRAVVPTIRELRDHAERITRHELLRAKKKLANTPPEEVIDEFARALSNKLLPPPLAALNAAQASEQEELIKLIRRLYRLRDTD